MISKRTMASLHLLLTTAILLGGCATWGGSLEYSPERLGTIGAAIHKQPENAEQILKEHDLDRDEFEESVERISEDPGWAKQYRKAFEREVENDGDTGN